jgi:hypothetical protein
MTGPRRAVWMADYWLDLARDVVPVAVLATPK